MHTVDSNQMTDACEQALLKYIRPAQKQPEFMKVKAKGMDSNAPGPDKRPDKRLTALAPRVGRTTGVATGSRMYLLVACHSHNVGRTHETCYLKNLLKAHLIIAMCSGPASCNDCDHTPPSSALQVVWEWQPRSLGRIARSLVATQERQALKHLEHDPRAPFPLETNVQVSGLPMGGLRGTQPPPRRRASAATTASTSVSGLSGASTIVENPMFMEGPVNRRIPAHHGTIFPPALRALR
jgi:hypothetical protein